MAGEAWDVLHEPDPTDGHWSTDNVGEAAPGVLTPLSWSIWRTVGDRAPREVAFRLGAFSRRDRRDFPDIIRPFYGRIAIRMEFLGLIGDRMPGVTGEEAVRSLCGRVPETMTFTPTGKRYPAIAGKLPRAMFTTPAAIRTMAGETDRWWRSQIHRLPDLTLEQSRVVLSEAVRRFDETLTIHSLGLLAIMQPLLVALTELVDRAGIGDIGELSGSGGAEMAIIEDIWKASRGELGVEDVIANHGFHGPLEGEMSSFVWRERSAPLDRMIGSYARCDEGESPVLRATLARQQLPELQRAIVAELPRARRPASRLLLSRAAGLLPLRGVGKRAFLQSLDVARGATRRLSELLELDAFYLTADELAGPLPADAADLVALRRQRRTEYEALMIPNMWRGVPEPSPPPRPPTLRPPTSLASSAGSGSARGSRRVSSGSSPTRGSPRSARGRFSSRRRPTRAGRRSCSSRGPSSSTSADR